MGGRRVLPRSRLSLRKNVMSYWGGRGGKKKRPPGASRVAPSFFDGLVGTDLLFGLETPVFRPDAARRKHPEEMCGERGEMKFDDRGDD